MPGGWNSPCLKEKRRPRLILPEGFNDIAAAVAKKSRRKGVVIDENSVENFNALGIQTKSPGLSEAAKKFDKVKPWQDNM